MNPQLTVMCGLPGANKTAVANLMKGVTVSRADHQNDAYETILDLLNQGQDVTYDAQNLTAKERTDLLNYVRSNYAHKHTGRIDAVCIYIQKSVVDCMKKLEDENRYMPIKALLQLEKQTQVPNYSEGWDCIMTVTQTIE